MTRKRDRARKVARERYERQQQKRLEHRRKVLRRAAITGSACVLAGVVVGGYFLVGTGGGRSAAASPPKSSTPSASAGASAVAEPAHHCTYTASGTAARKVSRPPATPNYTAHYQATIATNRGDIVVDLLNSKATCTVNSFVHLADQGFFNNTKCHRLTTSGGLYVLQCGDPTGTGDGGPGYTFASENLAGAKYTAGTVAMANTGAADSNGSQFFIVYKNTSLPARYTPFGTVISGLDIVKSVAKAGTDNGTGDGHPKEKVVIDRVTIRQT